MPDDIPTLPSWRVVRIRWPAGQGWRDPADLLRMDPPPEWVEVLAWTRSFGRALAICQALNRPGGAYFCIMRVAAPDAPIKREEPGRADQG